MSISKKKINEAVKAFQNIELLGTRVGVLKNEPRKMSRGGIHIPEDAQERAANGVVVFLGQGYDSMCKDPGCRGLKIGSWVTFNSYDGVLHGFTIDDEDYTVLAMDARQVYFIAKEGVVDGLG